MTAIGKTLKRLAGRVEWAVEVYAVRPVEKRCPASASGAACFEALAKERATERDASQRARAGIDTVVQPLASSVTGRTEDSGRAEDEDQLPVVWAFVHAGPYV